MAVDDGTGVPDPRASRVVLAGVPVYEAFEQLPAVSAGVKALREALTDRRIWGIGHAHCTVTAPGAGPGLILPEIRRSAAAATDTLLIYFSGHGIVDVHDGELYLALRHSLPDHPESALRYEYLRRAVLGSPARNKVVVIDCCYSGPATAGEMSRREEIADRTSIDGTFLLTSSAGSRVSLSPEGERFTA
ncbi:MAG TPA: caspase family protein, partial [Phytomonospora sp.]